MNILIVREFIWVLVGILDLHRVSEEEPNSGGTGLHAKVNFLHKNEPNVQWVCSEGITPPTYNPY